MATVHELSGPYGNFMLNPLAPAGDDVCSVCLTFTDGYATCYRCGFQQNYADSVLPISYSVHLGQLHTALAGYKRLRPPASTKFRLELAAVLWRFLGRHELCLAREAGTNRFDLVTTVPSGSADRDEAHPLREIVGATVEPTANRFARLLRRSSCDVADRVVSPLKYEPLGELRGESVLLIDDTWTTGSNVQSAAGALKSAGAATVGVLVIGRHIHEDFAGNRVRLAALPRPFDWDRCAFD